jgi:4-amino-4-deoxy-L-arabinose transferase-like glycosyltransferase
MAAIEPNGPGLIVFGATFAVFCLGFFTVAGMFPLSARPASLAGLPAAALIVANLILLVLLALAVALFAHQTLRWTSAVILGGLIFLFTPSAFQAVPATWRDSREGLAALGVIEAAALFALPFPQHVLSAL